MYSRERYIGRGGEEVDGGQEGFIRAESITTSTTVMVCMNQIGGNCSRYQYMWLCQQPSCGLWIVWWWVIPRYILCMIEPQVSLSLSLSHSRPEKQTIVFIEVDTREDQKVR